MRRPLALPGSFVVVIGNGAVVFLCGRLYFGENGRQIIDDTLVLEPHDPQAMRGDDGVARRIVLGLTLVDLPVYFDDETCGVAIEVRDKAADDLLSPEMQAAALVTSQLLPQHRFGSRHLPTHGTRTLLLLHGFPPHDNATTIHA
jgi:hypothetical protein